MDGKISHSQLDSFFDGAKRDLTSEKITINVNVDEKLTKGKSTKTIKTEIDLDGELIRHESLMTEMNAEDEDDEENIELLKTLINDDDEDGVGLLDQINDNEIPDLNKSIEKIDVLGENLLILKDDTENQEKLDFVSEDKNLNSEDE